MAIAEQLQENDLRSCTTIMSSATLTGRGTFTNCRHKCGTEQANSLQLVRRCNVQPCNSIPRPVWKGDVSRPRSEQGLKILGTPVGLDQLIAKHKGAFGTHSSIQRFAVRLVAVDFLFHHSRTSPSEVCSQSWPSGLLRAPVALSARPTVHPCRSRPRSL